MSPSLCKDCFRGVRHEGEAEGKWENINGVDCYVATPSEDYDKSKVLVFLPDVFGPQLINAQLLADDFARNGYKTVVPDYFGGDPVPAHTLGVDSPPEMFDFWGWLAKHGVEVTTPYVEKLVAGLKAAGYTSFAATGYCFGARFVFDLAYQGLLKAVVVSHPSLLENPADFERYAKESKAPLLINSCSVDPQFPADFQAKADEVFG
ncbi:hypothetical protein AX16_003500, partial [Volvariella volvacea WC 439]